MIKNIIGNLLSFNKMISEQIIKVVYYVGLLSIVFLFLRALYDSFTNGVVAFLPLLLESIVVVVLTVLLWRVICEVIIMVFRIHSRLGDINKALGGKNTEAAIPGDAMLNEVREAALKAKAAAAEKASTLKSSISKDDADDAPIVELKPAAKKPVKKVAAKAKATKTAATKAKTTAKKTTKTAVKKTTTTAKKTASKAAPKKD